MAKGSQYERKILIRGVLAVIGGVFLQISFGISYIFGNYTAYFTSYLRNRTSSSEVTYGETTWVATSGGIASVAILPLMGLLERKFHSKTIIIVSSLLASTSIICTYFTVQMSMVGMLCTYGLSQETFKLLGYVAVLKCTMSWFPEKTSLISGMVIGGYGFSSFVFNWMITLYINPTNLSPDVKVDGDKYFTQSVLLDRVPSSFLLLGGILLGMQVIGLILIAEPSTYITSTNVKVGLPEKENEEDRDLSTNGEGSTDDYGVKEAMKTIVIYLVWFMMMLFVYAVEVTGTSFKAYGQNFITDDHFLSIVASTSSVFNAFGRIVWGVVGVRLGMSFTMFLFLGGFAVSLSTLVCTEVLGRYSFLIWMCVIYFSMCGMWAILPAFMLKQYGKSNYITIVGLSNTSAAISSALTSISSTKLKPLIGWRYMFLLAAASTVISFVLALAIDVKARGYKTMKDEDGLCEVSTISRSLGSVNPRFHSTELTDFPEVAIN